MYWNIDPGMIYSLSKVPSSLAVTGGRCSLNHSPFLHAAPHQPACLLGMRTEKAPFLCLSLPSLLSADTGTRPQFLPLSFTSPQAKDLCVAVLTV